MFFTTNGRITSFGFTSRVRDTDDRRVDTSTLKRLTGIHSTMVIIFTIDVGMLTTLFGVTRVIGTWIVIITDERDIEGSTSFITIAIIPSTIILIIASNRAIDATRVDITRIFSTSIIVIANYISVSTSGIRFTIISSTSIMIITVNMNMLESISGTASIDSTLIIIIRRDRSKYTSRRRITRIRST